MKVSVVGPSNVDDFAYNIADGLRRMGHEASLAGSFRARQRFGYLGKAWSVARDLATRDPRYGMLLEKPKVRGILAGRPDLVITVESLRPDLVAELTSAGVPVVLWFPDHVSNLGALWMFAAPYRATFFKEPVLVDRVSSLTGLPVHYLPEACNPALHSIPEGPVPKTGKVAVVGNYYATRVRLLERLHDDGVPLELYGSPFPPFMRNHPLAPLHTGRYVRGAEKARVFRSASAVLNNLHPAEIDGVNCRLFEATACGAAVVCEDRPVLDSLYERAVEVEVFSEYESLLRILHGLLNDAEYSRALGDAASLRAITDHTYEARLRTIFEVIS